MKQKIKLILGSGGGLAAALSLVGSAFAQGTLQPPTNFGTLKNIDVNTIVPGIIRLLLFVAFIIAFIFLIIGGVRWILSGGDKAAAESARGTLTAAIIGLIIVLAAWAIMIIIEQAFGIPILTTVIEIPPMYK